MSCLLLHEHDEKYTKLLSQYQCTSLPVLQTNILNPACIKTNKRYSSISDNIPKTETSETTQDKIPDNSSVSPDDINDMCFDGLIITSKHAVTYIVQNSIQLSGKRIAIVGPNTSKLLTKCLGQQNSECGATNEEEWLVANNATQLSDMILNQCPAGLSWVFLCGDKTLNIIVSKLEPSHIISQIEVYQTGKRPNLDAELATVLNSHKYSFVVFFSPSGVSYTADILSSGLSGGCVLVAFGKSTAGKIGECFGSGYEVRVCREPTPGGLVRAINQCN